MSELKFKIFGPARPGASGIFSRPLWEARIDVFEHTVAAEDAEARALLALRDSSAEVPPDLVAIRGTVRNVDVRLHLGEPGLTRWEAGRQSALHVLLVVHVDPVKWNLQTIPAQCIAGEIPLDLVSENPVDIINGVSRPSDWPSLLATELRDARYPIAHSSGLTLTGSAVVPWQESNPLEGVYLVTLAFPLPKDVPNTVLTKKSRELRLEPDRSLWSETQRGQLRAALTRWSSLLASQPSAARLELTLGQEPPYLHWLVDPGERPRRINVAFEPGEIRLVLLGRDGASHSELHANATVAIERTDASLTISVTGGATATGRALRYQGARETRRVEGRPQMRWRDTLSLETGPSTRTPDVITARYDSLAVAARLRESHALPEPDYDARALGGEPIEALLWGSVALADGWAQLPFLNVTAESYRRAGVLPKPAGPAKPAQPLLRGGAVFGNVGAQTGRKQASGNDEVLLPGEHRWSLTLLDAEGFRGRWQLTDTDTALTLDTIDLVFLRPELALDGFLWLGLAHPTAADALPSIENWVAGLETIVLKTPIGEPSLFPSPFAVEFEELSLSGLDGDMVELGAWTTRLRVDNTPLFTKLHDFLKQHDGRPDDAPAAAFAPIAWRRHPAMALIQALPLTQNQLPANYPSQSRQLAPFALPRLDPGGEGWSFAASSAQDWPRLQTRCETLAEWSNFSQLPMVGLSVPGVILEAAAEPARLRPSLEFGLPYAAELYAFARLPQDPDKAVPEPPGPPNLRRETFVHHWDRLDERGFLARAEAERAGKVAAGAVIQGLVDPFGWPVDATLNSSYPATVTLTDGSGLPPLVLRAESALRGIEGRFTETVDHSLVRSNNGPLRITAGSLAARLLAKKVRDQRGWWRAATTLTEGSTMMRTPVEFERAAGEARERWELCSLLQPVDMQIDGARWKFWFRDLPVQRNAFIPPKQSSAAAGVNDPAATSRELAPLTGYEWRLADQTTPEVPEPEEVDPFAPLRLFGLDFFPLALEAVSLSGDAVCQVTILGRLQLPAIPASQHTWLANRVRLCFAGEGSLTLDEVSAAPVAEEKSLGEWPLGDEANAPRLTWKEVGLSKGRDALEVRAPRLHFHLLGAAWSLPEAAAPLVFRAGAAATVAWELNAALAEGFIARRADVEIAPGTPTRHTTTLSLDLRWGTPGAIAFAAQLTCLLPKGNLTTLTAGFPNLAVDVREERETSLHPSAVQFKWKKWADPTTAYLLPGVQLDSAEQGSGYAAMAFQLTSRFDQLPTARISAASCEAIVPCRWGAALQDAASPIPSREAVFGSSAGRLYGAFTATFSQPQGWQSSLLLNGWIEVKNLISWPSGDNARHHLSAAPLASFSFAIDQQEPEEGAASVRRTLRALSQAYPGWRWRVEGHASVDKPVAGNEALSRARAERIVELWREEQRDVQTVALPFGESRPILSANAEESARLSRRVEIWPVPVFVSPASRGAGEIPFDHLRHTIRILLNQHRIEGAALAPGGERTLANLAPDRPWQLLAVVQHELTRIPCVRREPNTEPEIGARDSTRCWTTIQEVRLALPKDFTAFLRDLNRRRTFQPGKHATLRRLPDVDTGYHAREVLESLIATPFENALVVEASAPLWIRQGAQVAVAGETLTALQYLPGLTQRALLSSLSDFQDEGAPGGKRTSWMLLAFPFVGRLQASALDFDTHRSRLGADPVWQLARHSPRIEPHLLLLAFTSRSDGAPREVTLAEFDVAPARLWPRLDPLTLRESWFRVQNPPDDLARAVATDVAPAGIMETLPTDSPGQISRPAAMARNFDWRRTAWPPVPPPADPPAGDDPLLVWREGGLFTPQAQLDPGDRLLGFIPVGAQILSSFLAGEAGTATIHPAATLIPARVADADPVPPVSFTVSPYLLLGFTEPKTGQTVVLRVADIVGGDTRAQRLALLANEVWAPQEGVDAEDAMRLWSDRVVNNLAPDSPIAVLRLRIIRADSRTAQVSVEHDFRTLKPAPRIEQMSPPAAVRAPAEHLFFAEGQFAGTRLAAAPATPFEIAPPQVPGVQPIYVNEMDPTRALALSAMRHSVRFTSGERGIAGSARRLWWQGCRHFVQFAMPGSDNERELLPKSFRAPAAASLLPQPPNLPLPSAEAVLTSEPGQQEWQPIQPGVFRQLVVGARAGAPFVFIHRLFTQSRGDNCTLASGGLPLQHRMVRPLPLPENDFEASRLPLRPWSTGAERPAAVDDQEPLPFHRKEAQHVSWAQLADHAFFDLPMLPATAPTANEPAPLPRPKPALSVTLLGPQEHALSGSSPAPGTIRAESQEKLVFHAPGLAQWHCDLALIRAADRLPLAQLVERVADHADWVVFQLEKTTPLPDGRDPSAWLGSLRDGDALVLEMAVEPRDPPTTYGQERVTGYRQVLRFPVRIFRGQIDPLPLLPVSIQFEDPEYNRRLTTTAAETTRQVRENGQLQTLKLAADRRQYNPSSRALFVFTATPPLPPETALELKLARKTEDGEEPIDRAPIPVTPGKAVDVGLGEGRPPLLPDDILKVTIQHASGAPLLDLLLEIVATPVIPAPEAAYGLLRALDPAGSSAETVRFAWAPAATRIELLDPNDILNGTVRRRAVFQWLHAARARTEQLRYAIQKVNAWGGTHFPRLSSFP